MNDARRKQIEAIKERIDALLAQASDIASDVEAIRDEEQAYRDNMPDSLASGEKGQKADAAIEALESVLTDLESLTDDPFAEALATATE